MGHLELNGFEAHRGYIMDHGDSTAPYRQFEKVFSGHYHRKSTRGNISYLGNPYQIYWNDYRDRRGFHIFDTETLELEYIQNPYEIYQKYIMMRTTYNQVCLSIMSLLKVLSRLL